jgi:hypothetical protein
MGLTELGAHAVRGLIERGMLFDPDHMSAAARHQALDVIESAGYSGVVSSHSWSDPTVYRRVHKLGGVVTPHAGSSSSMVGKHRDNRAWSDDRFLFGLGYGSDMNGFSGQGSPRGAGVPNPVSYPFTGLGGVSIQKQQSGTKSYDYNVEGVAHYGMYADYVEDVRILGGQEVVNDMANAAEAYLQMWERAIGVPGNACRDDVADLSDATLSELAPRMTPEQVLHSAGQAKARTANAFTFCATGGRTATATFGPDGLLSAVTVD